MKDKESAISPKDVFLHLLMTGTLYAAVFSFLALVFQYVNFFFPDPLAYMRADEGAMRNAVASLIILFPVFLFTSYLLHKEYATHPHKLHGRLRTWLVSFTLFVAAIVIIVDLVGLILNFLEGELTARFLLKNLSVLLVIGAIFGYYINALKKEKPYVSSKEKGLIRAISLVLLISVIGSFFIMSSPFAKRLEKFDSERTRDLQTIQRHAITYYQQKEMVPETLEDLRDPLLEIVIPRDPKTNEPYEYRRTDVLSFELCAVFETSTLSEEYAPAAPERSIGIRAVSENWNHPQGRFCFLRTIDPERI